MTNNSTTPSRQEILQEILSCFQMMFQSMPSFPENYTKYHFKAEALIELLEIVDCGSVGGFDRNNPSVNFSDYASNCHPKEDGTDYEMFDRFLMILRKYPTDLDSECNHNVMYFAEYFKALVIRS